MREAFFEVINYRGYSKWFLRPSRNLYDLNSRLDTVEFFLRPDIAYLSESLQDSLKMLKYMPVSCPFVPL